MINIDKIKSFWESKHRENNKSYLSGCDYIETIKFLQVEPLIKIGATVLEIGVGMGYVTKRLYDLGCDVTALDISVEALQRVHSYCEETYLLTELNLLPVNYFDVIICHNTIQHIPTSVLEEELNAVLRSLRVDGTFALQFVSAIGFEDACIQETGEGCYCRTPEVIQKMVGKYVNNCEFRLVVNNSINAGKITGCHVLHVIKR